MRSKNGNALLVEIMIAVLCFSLAATVIMQTFVKGRKQSDEAAAYAAMLVQAQNLADRISMADDAALQEILLDGTQEGETTVFPLENGMSLRVTVQDEKTAAGVLRRAAVCAFYQGEQVLTLPCSAYRQEVAQ